MYKVFVVKIEYNLEQVKFELAETEDLIIRHWCSLLREILYSKCRFYPRVYWTLLKDVKHENNIVKNSLGYAALDVIGEIICVLLGNVGIREEKQDAPSAVQVTKPDGLQLAWQYFL